MEAEIEKERVAREKAEQETLKARVERDKSFQEVRMNCCLWRGVGIIYPITSLYCI